MRARHLISRTLCCICLAMSGASTAAAAEAMPKVSTLFGVFDFPTQRAREFPFTVTRAGPRDLPSLQESGLKALVALTGSRRNYSDSRGCFQLALWKKTLDGQDSARIQALVSQGAILGLYAIDEPHDWPCGPSFEDIDAACAYALQKWPAIKCGVNAPPAWLRPGASKLSHIGFVFVQYSSRKGEPASWMRSQLEDASWFGGDIWLSIQLLQPWLSVDAARRAALTFCGARPVGVLMWKWSDQWFTQPGADTAMRDVAEACGTPRPAGAASTGRRAR